jgi:quinol monooxygenase YgiN
MAEKKVTVMALIKVKAGLEEKARNELLLLLKPTRAEKGCINSDLHQSLDHKNHFMFYENWVSKKDLDEHLSMPHMKSHLEKFKDFLAGPPELMLWEKIG